MIQQDSLNFSRELFRSQIAFGSDPLDELGLTGARKFYDTAYHSLFKVDFLGDLDAQRNFTPYFHAKDGLVKIFTNFNRGYFSRNYDKNRRFYSHEIAEFASKINTLEDNQKGNMLAKMVKELEPLDYSDDIIGRIDLPSLDQRYVDYKNIAGELKMLNDSYLKNDKGEDVTMGLLGRWTFASPQSDVIREVINAELFIPDQRRAMLRDGALYDDFFNKIARKPSKGKKGNYFGTFEFKAKSSPWNDKYQKYFYTN